MLRDETNLPAASYAAFDSLAQRRVSRAKGETR
jgi:hypothetical protein